MRIQILADVGDGITLPVNYNHLLAGVIYRFLAESDPEYASFLHEEGYRAAEKRFKLFTFSQLMAERRRITGDKIHFRSTLTWSVSSPVERFLSHFADTLLTEGRLSLAQHQLPIRDVTIPRIPRFQSEMQFRCLSPITMSTKTRARWKTGNALLHARRFRILRTHPSKPHPQTRSDPRSLLK